MMNRHRNPLSLWPRLVLTGMLLAAQLGAQPDQSRPVDQRFGATIQVSLVNVDVYVTDEEGRPVTGLEEQDFELFVDGRPVEISHFAAVRVERRAPMPPADRSVDAGAERRAPRPQPPTTGAEAEPQGPLRIILLIDNANLRTSERNRILPQLRGFLLDRTAPAGQILLMQYDRSLQVVQPFTQDRFEVAEALSQLAEVSGHRGQLDTQQRIALREIESAESDAAALLWARNFAESRVNEVRHMVSAIRELIGSLAGLPGRKVLFYISSGIPMIPGEALFHAVAARFPRSNALSEIPRYDLSRQFDRLASYANSCGVNLYAVDAGGLRATRFGTAEYGGFSTPGLRSTLDSVAESNLQLPLRFLAQRTGGLAILNQNDVFTPLQRIGKGLSSFYSLAFADPHSGDGRFHSIRVEVDRPDVEVRHRDGYRGKDRETRMREAVRSALHYAVESDPFGLEVTFLPPEPGDAGEEWLLPMRVRVPLRKVVLFPRSDGRHEVRLRLAVAAIDASGERSKVQEIPLGLFIPDAYVEEARGEAYLFTHRLRVEPGRQRIALALLDELGGEMAVITRGVEVGE